MMKHFKTTIIFLILALPIMDLFAQNAHEIINKHRIKKEIGFQINPYLNRSLFDENTLGNMVFALRGGILLNDRFSFGLEFSENFYKNIDFTVYSYNPGIYLKYLLLKQKRWHPFMETNIYYEIAGTKIINKNLIQNGISRYDNSKFSYFIAPGIDFPIYKKIIMFDFMIKVSSEKFFFGGNVVPSYRIRFLF